MKRPHQYRHARERALERHGVRLSQFDCAAIGAQIEDGRDWFPMQGQGERSNMASSVSGGAELWVRYRGKWLPVVYDFERRFLVTILPDVELEHLRDMLQSRDERNSRH